MDSRRLVSFKHRKDLFFPWRADTSKISGNELAQVVEGKNKSCQLVSTFSVLLRFVKNVFGSILLESAVFKRGDGGQPDWWPHMDMRR